MPLFSVSRWTRYLLPALLLSPATCFALACKTEGAGETIIRSDLGSTVAIPASAPDGDVVWRSERFSLQVVCAKDGLQAQREEIFIHLNPDNLPIGQGIRAGLTLNGVDYLQSGGRIGTGQFLPVCHESDSNVGACPTVTLPLAFSVFIQKFGATPPSGVASDVLDYRLFQLGGLAYSPRAGQSLSYQIDSLRGLRFVACDAELQIVPETVEFGSIGIQKVVVGSVIDSRPFSLRTSRNCDSPFSLSARFKPVTGWLKGGFLIPMANNGVGIRMVNARNGTPLRYNEPFHLADLLGDTTQFSVDFNAELVWQSSQPKAGPFEAEVMVDLFYK